MRNENGIIATTIEVEPGPRDEDVAVVLDGERRVRVAATDRALVGVLEALRERRYPAYVEVEPGGDLVTRLLIPRITRIDGIEEQENTLLLEVAGSHAAIRLDLGEAEAADVASDARRALEDRSLVLLVEDDAHRVLDLVSFTPGPDGPELPPFPELPVPEPRLPRLPFWTWWWDWLTWILWWRWRCPSVAGAQLIFDQMAATTCPPLTAPAPCVTFLYPDDGCFARAHEMCRLMQARGHRPRKVWNYRDGPLLHVDTRNNPSCFVEWTYHVAPTLCVRLGPWWWPFFFTARMVIDPALFTTPVSVDDWKAIQQRPASTIEHTGPEPFWPRPGYPPDPTYTETNYWLDHFRLQLVLRSAQHGPPPYAHCSW